MDKRKIRVRFTDFYGKPGKEELAFYQILRENYDVEESDEPDYIFASVFGDEHLKYRDAVKVLFTPENVSPDFNLFDYAIGFDYLTYGDRYIRMPFCYNPAYKKDFERIKLRGSHFANTKSGFCSIVVSNGFADSERSKMMDVLNKYKTVSSGGGWRNNMGGALY